MKKILIFVIAVLMVTFCMLPATGVSAAVSIATVKPDPYIEIGLYYALNALPSANLQNVTGMDLGYELGYFDSSTREFYPLYYTEEYMLTVLKDKIPFNDKEQPNTIQVISGERVLKAIKHIYDKGYRSCPIENIILEY